MAIRKIGDCDLIIGGRQAIDGDTAQVGPQVAEKLGLNQVTYVNDINECDGKEITITRHIDGGTEVVKAPLPIMLTVNGDAAPCRPPQCQKSNEIQTCHDSNRASRKRRTPLCGRI